MKNLKLFFNIVALITFGFVVTAVAQIGIQFTVRWNGPGGSDDGSFVATDNSANAYVLGQTGVASNSNIVLIKYNSLGDTVWSKMYEGPGHSEDTPAGILVDPSGDIYVTGFTINFGTGYDMVTLKYNSSGNQQWARIYNGPGNGDDKPYDIEVGASGDVYVTGESLGSGTGSDCITIKYNSAGVQQWAVRKNGLANNTDRGYDIQLVNGPADTIVVTGMIINTANSSDFLTIKYNSAGGELWARTYNATVNENDIASSISNDQQGNLYVTGRTFSTATNFDFVTIKYNQAGDTAWVRRYNGPTGNGTDIPRKAKVDTQGNVWVAGYSTGIGTGLDYATIKYNSSGTQQFVSRYNGPANSSDLASSLDIDASGNAYVTGQSAGSGTGNDYATIKYNSSGDTVWVKRYNGTGNGSDIARSIKINGSNIYVTGQSFGTSNDIVTINYSQSNACNLSLSLMIQGFYDSFLNNTRSDTVKISLRNSTSPYNVADFYKAILSSSGTGTFTFPNASNGINYYIAAEHRNSIETWSSTPVSFTSNSLTYDFSANAGQAYGSNEIQIDASPVRYGIYSGDVNQDKIIDLTDVINIFNDAADFSIGYLTTDLNGDNIVDLTDVTIGFNNSNNFVTSIQP